MAVVWIPALLRPLTEGKSQVVVEGETVRAIVEGLEARYPGVAARILDEDRIRPGLSVAVDGAVGHKGLREPVGPESEVHFVPAMTGGA
ncbi:MAG: MoaD/ThiS family protein [Caldilineaceae bacterium]|nr:MoaD/ThiS family protein [Caldilineaceae bacterium]HRJ42981.1 MoaD/ThiS family protein [Caldilineaceae bacterium]